MKLGVYFDIQPSLWCMSSVCSGVPAGRDMLVANLISSEISYTGSNLLSDY